MKNSIILMEMLKIYGPLTVDWMGFPITNSNYLTYHHIEKKSDRGETSLNNCALIGRKSHRLLNILEFNKPDLYEEWNILFSIICESKRPPDEEMKEWINALRERTLSFVYGDYKVKKNEEITLKKKRSNYGKDACSR